MAILFFAPAHTLFKRSKVGGQGFFAFVAAGSKGNVCAGVSSFYDLAFYGYQKPCKPFFSVAHNI
jgi:hypothetical protein